MKKIPFSRIQIEELSKSFPTPFYVYDEEAIIKNLKSLQDAFSWADFKEYFAVKATPTPKILELFKSHGCGFDCASSAELELAFRLGAKGEDIMFTSNDTPKEEFQKAESLGAIINLDDESHIDFLQKHAKIPKTICLRFNPGDEFQMQNDIIGKLKNSKFGMTLPQLISSVKKLKALGVEHFGLHCMPASCCLEEEYYPALLALMFDTAKRIFEETKVKLEFFDMAGGIGIPYRPEERKVDIFKIGARCREVFEEKSAKTQIFPKLFVELGRFMTGPYGYLVSRVLHIKESYKTYVGLDATACCLMRPAMYGAYHGIVLLGKEEETPAGIFDVTGSLCENNDKFAVDRPLTSPQIGDIAVLCDCGAHGHSMGYNYNGKLRPAEFLLKKDGSFELIRRAQTIEDYFAQMIF